MEYANKFIELSRFAPEYVATDRMRMLRFEEGLAFYIRNQLAGQPVQSSQELYEQAAEIERAKEELRIVGKLTLRRDGMIEVLWLKGLLTKSLFYRGQNPKTLWLGSTVQSVGEPTMTPQNVEWG